MSVCVNELAIYWCTKKLEREGGREFSRKRRRAFMESQIEIRLFLHLPLSLMPVGKIFFTIIN